MRSTAFVSCGSVLFSKACEETIHIYKSGKIKNLGKKFCLHKKLDSNAVVSLTCTVTDIVYD